MIGSASLWLPLFASNVFFISVPQSDYYRICRSSHEISKKFELRILFQGIFSTFKDFLSHLINEKVIGSVWIFAHLLLLFFLALFIDFAFLFGFVSNFYSFWPLTSSFLLTLDKSERNSQIHSTMHFLYGYKILYISKI